MWIGTGKWSRRSPGQVGSDPASSHIGSVRAPAGAQPFTCERCWEPWVYFQPLLRPLKTICCLRRGWFVGFESTKLNLPPNFSISWLQTRMLFMLIFCLLPPCSLPTLPQVLWVRSFGLGLIPPSTSCRAHFVGRALGCCDTTRGSQVCPCPFAVGTR